MLKISHDLAATTNNTSGYDGSPFGVADDWPTAIGADSHWPDGGAPLTANAFAPLANTAVTETQSVVFSPVSVTHDEGYSGATGYVFTVTRSGGTTGNLNFSGTIAAGTTNAVDFFGGVAPTTFSGSIVAGQASATVTVNVAGDTLVEANESFSLTLTSVSNASGVSASIGASATATGTITNDDGNLSLGDRVWIDANANGIFDAGEGGASGVVLSLFADTNSSGGFDPIDVQLATTTTSASGGYSFVGLTPGNYIVRVDAANFQSGGALFGLQTTVGSADPDDDVDNDDNGVAATGGAVASQTITLASNSEPTPAGGNVNNTLDFGFRNLDPSVSISDVSLREGNSGTTSFVFTVTRSGGPAAFTVGYATANGSATGSDYTATSGTLSFAAGENAKTITVLVTGDTLHESDETFLVNLANPTGGAIIADGAGVGTILDDEATGDSGNNTLTGTGGADTFYLQQGGDDTVSGGAGNDIFYYGSALTAADQNDGGTDIDTLVLQGNYNLVLGAGNVVGIEGISLQSGSITRWGDTAGNLYDFALTTLDANVGAGQQMRINGQSLLAGEDLTFNGSAESDGKFLVYGGFGVDTLTGGAGGDVFFFEAGRFGAGDTVNGGPGNDAMVISGSSGSALLTVNIASGSMTSIEALSFNGRFQSDPTATPSYTVTLQNGNIAPGAALIVNGSSLGATQSLTFNGSAEANGRFIAYGGAGGDNFTGGAGADQIQGGAGADLLKGGGGADVLWGQAGNDTFGYLRTTDSTQAATDLISDFTTGDLIDLSAVDADAGIAGRQAFRFIGSQAFTANVAGDLRAVETQAGQWRIEGDTNGDTIADFVLTANTTDGAPIDAADFVLGTDQSPLLLDFEGLISSGYGSMAQGQGGFHWGIIFDDHNGGTFISNQPPDLVRKTYLPGTGYEYGSIPPGELVAQVWDRGVELIRSDAADFQFESGYLTSAWNSNVEVTLYGYNNGVLVGSYLTSIGNTGPTYVAVDWPDIDQLKIIQTGASYTNMVMDNLLFGV